MGALKGPGLWVHQSFQIVCNCPGSVEQIPASTADIKDIIVDVMSAITEQEVYTKPEVLPANHTEIFL